MSAASSEWKIKRPFVAQQGASDWQSQIETVGERNGGGDLSIRLWLAWKTLLKLVTFRENQIWRISYLFLPLLHLLSLSVQLVSFPHLLYISHTHTHRDIDCMCPSCSREKLSPHGLVCTIDLKGYKSKTLLLLLLHLCFSFSESASLGLVKRMEGWGLDESKWERDRRHALFPGVLVDGISTEE